MKKAVFVFLGFCLLMSVPLCNHNVSYAKNLSQHKNVKHRKAKKHHKNNKKVSKSSNIGVKRLAGSDENFNYYEISQKDGTVNFLSEVNAKYPKTHLLPFIHDYQNGLAIKQKENYDGTINIKYNGNPSLLHNFKNAVQTWNQLGIIKFKVVNSFDKAQVNVYGNSSAAEDKNSSDYTEGRLGDSYNYVDYHSHAKLSDGTPVQYIAKTNVKIYSPILDESDNNKDHVIIHELGHALGFDDLSNDDDRALIMYGTSAVGSILLNNLNSCEKMSLQHYYQ